MKLFDKLNSIDVNQYTEKKDGLDYLNWASAFRILEQHTDSVNYRIIETPEGLPFWDSELGIFVKTEMTIDGITKSMVLPVLDYKNNPMYSTAGKIVRFNKEIDRPVASSFDINTATMRCFVKNMAMFGLGNYIYEGLDLPEAETIISAKILSAEEIENKRKKELWLKFTEDIKDEEIAVDDFLAFNKVKKDDKAKLMKFVESYVADSEKRNKLVIAYKNNIEKQKTI